MGRRRRGPCDGDRGICGAWRRALLMAVKSKSLGGRWRRSAWVEPAALKAMMAVNRDILIRTLCLQTAFVLFTAIGARLGDVQLAANAVLLLFHFVMAMGWTVSAFAAESPCRASLRRPRMGDCSSRGAIRDNFRPGLIHCCRADLLGAGSPCHRRDNDRTASSGNRPTIPDLGGRLARRLRLALHAGRHLYRMYAVVGNAKRGDDVLVFLSRFPGPRPAGPWQSRFMVGSYGFHGCWGFNLARSLSENSRSFLRRGIESDWTGKQSSP